jgi:hypothetical protein
MFPPCKASTKGGQRIRTASRSVGAIVWFSDEHVLDNRPRRHFYLFEWRVWKSWKKGCSSDGVAEMAVEMKASTSSLGGLNVDEDDDERDDDDAAIVEGSFKSGFSLKWGRTRTIRTTTTTTMDAKSTVSSFYGGRKPNAVDVAKGHTDDASSFFQPDRASQRSADLLNHPSSAGYNRMSFLHAGRQEPLKGGYDEEEGQTWDVYADFNNAGPRYSNTLIQNTQG